MSAVLQHVAWEATVTIWKSLSLATHWVVMMVVDCSLASERGPAWINKAMFLFLFDLVWKMVQVAEFLTSPAAYAGNASSLVEVIVVEVIATALMSMHTSLMTGIVTPTDRNKHKANVCGSFTSRSWTFWCSVKGSVYVPQRASLAFFHLCVWRPSGHVCCTHLCWVTVQGIIGYWS